MKKWFAVSCALWSIMLFGQLPKNSLGLRLGYGNNGPDVEMSYQLRGIALFSF